MKKTGKHGYLGEIGVAMTESDGQGNGEVRVPRSVYSIERLLAARGGSSPVKVDDGELRFFFSF